MTRNIMELLRFLGQKVNSNFIQLSYFKTVSAYGIIMFKSNKSQYKPENSDTNLVVSKQI